MKTPEQKKRNRERSKEYYWENREAVLKKTEAYRKKNKKKISEREAARRFADPDRFEINRKKHKKWSSKNRERLNAYQRDWYQKNKEKRRAHVTLHRAILKGVVKKGLSCEQCHKQGKMDGHHEDYTQPLKVIWLCKTCHMRKSPRTVIKI